eukprot:292808-Amorphochlora_amoeboformis.AAC.1
MGHPRDNSPGINLVGPGRGSFQRDPRYPPGQSRPDQKWSRFATKVRPTRPLFFVTLNRGGNRSVFGPARKGACQDLSGVYVNETLEWFGVGQFVTILLVLLPLLHSEQIIRDFNEYDINLSETD